MFPKEKRIKDNGLIKEIKQIGYCEVCYRSDRRLETHHIKSKGSGGHDVPLNLICLCYVCHREVHDGNIERDRLREITHRREGVRYVSTIG